MTDNKEPAEIERLRQENDRLRAENNALRPLVAELRHQVNDLHSRCAKCPNRPQAESHG